MLALGRAVGRGVRRCRRDEVRFDIIYSAVPPPVRRVFTIVTSVATDRAVWQSRCRRRGDYVTFMKGEQSAYLGMRFDYLYSIY